MMMTFVLFTSEYERGEVMHELFYCHSCDIGRVDDNRGVWDMRDVEKYPADVVPELYHGDGSMVNPPICPVHGDDMEDEYDRVERIRDEELGGGW